MRSLLGLRMDDDSVRAPPVRRTVLFLLSPRVIDFDTFLPTAMELKAARPGWDLRFVTFEPRNADFIRRNDTFLAGLLLSGPLYCLGSPAGTGVLARWWRRVIGMVRLSVWLLRYPVPVLFAPRSFTAMPYNFLYALARLRGGSAFLLWKSSSPDRVHHIVWRNRELPSARPVTWLNRLLGRDLDGIVHYHDEQDEAIGKSDCYGRIAGVPWRRMGMPHRLPAWRRLVAAETIKEMTRLRATGVAADAELYCMFAAKPYSAVNLRGADSVERVFRQAIEVLCRRRPKAVVLIRPHPLAVDEPYIAEGIASVGRERARICFAHPEVLLAICRRAIFNNPSNIMFACYPGRVIDVSDYADSHYRDMGEVSLADGYGPLFVRPGRADFESAFIALLEDDAAFDDRATTYKREALLAANPATLTLLLRLIEKGDDT